MRAHSMPGSATSTAYRVVPVTLSRPSMRGTAVPTTLNGCISTLSGTLCTCQKRLRYGHECVEPTPVQVVVRIRQRHDLDQWIGASRLNGVRVDDPAIGDFGA